PRADPAAETGVARRHAPTRVPHRGRSRGDGGLKFLKGFAEIADEYDGFILDLWGVIHDGVNPIQGAPECLERLHEAGKRAVLLSNAPRRSSVIARQLGQMGIPDAHYTGVMTSGEASHIVLRDRPDAWYKAVGERVFHLG